MVGSTRWKHPALAAAEHYGLDLSLLENARTRSPAERLRVWDDHSQFFRSLRTPYPIPWTLPLAVLAGFTRARIRYVLVRDAAVTIRGAATMNASVEICYARDAASEQRLAGLLASWGARPRRDLGQTVRSPAPDEAALHQGHAFLLDTEQGRMDLLPHLPGVGAYASCREVSEEVDLDGLQVRVLTLEALQQSARTEPWRPGVLIELEALAALSGEA